MRLIFMGTPDFSVPTLIELAARGHEIVAVYTRAPKPAGRGMDLQPTPVEREARRLGAAGSHAEDAEGRRRGRDFPRAQRRRGGGRRLRTDPAETNSRCATPRLLQRACFAAAALARRGADQPRHHGGRCRNRRHHHEDGRGTRHRRDGDGRSHADRCRHDGGRIARRVVATGRRSHAALRSLPPKADRLP